MDDQQRIMAMMVLAEDQQKATQAAIDDLKAQQATLADLAQAVRRSASQGAGGAVYEAMKEASKGASAVLDAGASAMTTATTDAQKAATAFSAAVGRVGWRIFLVAFVAAILGVLVVLGTAFLSLAWQQHQVAELRQERADLVQEVAGLKANADAWAAKAGKAKLTSCGAPGEKGRLCVQIDTKAGIFGDGRDYAVLKGY